ncbi:MAG: hypothetical protein IKZ92_05315 [Muribaculaceae bacterium]|nr:hypothetical protein [Muribaculaceae bacterium]
MGLPSGTLWATCNVGANAPENYGYYFAWGETEPKGCYDWNTYKWCTGYPGSFLKYHPTVDNKVELDLGDDAAYVNWGASWHMPTLEQIQELIENCTGQSTTQNGVNGLLVTGPNGNTMFLPAAGDRNGDTLSSAGLGGYSWSRTLSSSDPSGAYSIVFSFDTGDGLREGHYYRYIGFPVRAVRVSQN